MSKSLGISGSGGPLGFPHREEVRTEPADVKADRPDKAMAAELAEAISRYDALSDEELIAKMIANSFPGGSTTIALLCYRLRKGATAIKEAVAREREIAAEIAEGYLLEKTPEEVAESATAVADIAAAIRERK